MIQRIQTLYLLAAGFAVVVVPALSSVSSLTNPVWLFPVLALLSIAVGAGSLGTIFLYRRRTFQRKLIVLLQYAILALLVVLFGAVLWTGRSSELLRLGSGFWAALILPVLTYVALMLARKGVDRDIEEVESLEKFRLR
jgi:hypothetical protein